MRHFPFSNLKNYSTMPLSQKIAYILCILIRIAVLSYAAYEIYLNITTGRQTSNLLLYAIFFTAPGGIYRLIATRNELNGNTKELKKHNKVILRSILGGICITLFVVLFSVISALYG